MAQRRAAFNTVDFRGGVNTDASPLNYPPESARAIRNLVIGNDGSLQRRLGIQAMVSRELPAISGVGNYLDVIRSGRTNAAIWKSSGGGAKDYLVVNYGGRLIEFYEMDDISSPIIAPDFTKEVGDVQTVPVPVLTIFKDNVLAAVGSSYVVGAVGVDNVVINTTRDNVVLYDLYSTFFGQEPDNTTVVRFVINSNVTIGSSSTNLPAVDSGVFPVGANVSIDNLGTIVGQGGAGGSASTNRRSRSTSAGANGGDAILLRTPINEFNNAGIIGGGGGGGGGAAATSFTGAVFVSYWAAVGGGGGGQGRASSSGGGASASNSNGNDTKPGSAGQPPSPGTGGRARFSTPLIATLRANGGNGGALGMNGASGSAEGNRNSASGGGSAGTGIRGYANVLSGTVTTNQPVGDNKVVN